MSTLDPIVITSIVALIAAFIPIIFRKNEQKLISEDIEKITNPDGTKIKKKKRKYKA